jgi:CTP synthase (UTP-ammonia lyase)
MEDDHYRVGLRAQVCYITHDHIFFSQERLFDRVSGTLVGKYTDLKDSYMSVIKALEHSAFRCQR